MSWEEESYRREEETENLTPQQKEAMIKEQQKRREKEYRRGRRIVLAMLALYVGMQVISLGIEIFSKVGEGPLTGYFVVWMIRIGIVAFFVYAIWHGERWVRRIFSAVLALSVLFGIQKIFTLDIVRTDYSKPGIHSTHVIYISEEGGSKGWEALSGSEIRSLQKSEDERVKVERMVFLTTLVSIAISGAYLYVLVGSRAAREFFSEQQAGW